MKTANKLFTLLALLALLLTVAPIQPAHAASTITVNSLADIKAVDGSCTLREAIQNANNNAATNIDCAAGSGSDTITFSLSGTITLGIILPTIADAAGLTLDGIGQAVTISGNNVSRIAVVPPSASLTLNRLTIANGYTSDHGGAILSSGTLVILNSVFSENNAYYFGGGILNSGALTITNSVFSGNTASKGGGIYNDAGALTITSSTFFNNSASGGEGGGINVFSGSLTITDSTFNQNSASLGSGGGIYNAVGTLTITNSTFSENTANYGEGGGIYNSYMLTIKFSTFTNNSSGSGGGILNSGAYFTVANSTFSGNNVSASGVNGGGILNEDYGLVVNSTFSGNSAPNGGGAIGSTNSHLTLRNTIVANSGSSGNCAGTITNGGSNLDDGVTCGWGSAFGSISDTNPDLGAPVGSPAYFPLNAGSPAIDKGDDPICAASPVNNQSQNGITRPQGAHCDIGSYEVFSPNIVPTDISLSNTSVTENLPSGTTVGMLSTTDPDAGDTHTYSFACTVPGADDASFTLLGKALNTAAVFDYETKNTYAICLRTDDGNGGTFDKNFTITVTDVVETLTVTFRSTGAQDGWVLESTETSGVGGTLDSAASTFRLGDDNLKKQYRGILSFSTGAGLPDDAIIAKVTLKVKKQGITGGGNPVNTFKGFMLDIKRGFFGTTVLQTTDFQAAAHKTYGPFVTALGGGWYSIDLTPGKGYINKWSSLSGLTQIRLRFKLDDNNNTVANYLSLYSGNAPAASRPQLIIQYYVP